MSGEHVREDAGTRSLADVSCHVCELRRMGEVCGDLVRPPTCPRVRLLAPCASPACFCRSPHLQCACWRTLPRSCEFFSSDGKSLGTFWKLDVGQHIGRLIKSCSRVLFSNEPVQGVPQLSWGCTYAGFLPSGASRGWLAGLEGG